MGFANAEKQMMQMEVQKGTESTEERLHLAAEEHQLIQVLLKKAEQAKIALDHLESVSVELNVTEVAHQADDPSESPTVRRATVSRERFSEINEVLITRMLEPIQSVLDRAGVQKSEVFPLHMACLVRGVIQEECTHHQPYRCDADRRRCLGWRFDANGLCTGANCPAVR